MYEGEWKKDKRHGRGTGIMADGRRYDGEWEEDMRSGFGIFRWPTTCNRNGGDSYAGYWKDSKRHGPGTLKLITVFFFLSSVLNCCCSMFRRLHVGRRDQVRRAVEGR